MPQTKNSVIRTEHEALAYNPSTLRGRAWRIQDQQGQLSKNLAANRKIIKGWRCSSVQRPHVQSQHYKERKRESKQGRKETRMKASRELAQGCWGAGKLDSLAPAPSEGYRPKQCIPQTSRVPSSRVGRQWLPGGGWRSCWQPVLSLPWHCPRSAAGHMCMPVGQRGVYHMMCTAAPVRTLHDTQSPSL